MILLLKPPTAHSAFNPVLLKYYDDTYFSATIVIQNGSSTILNGSKTFTLKRYAKLDETSGKYIVTFDLSSVVKLWLDEKITYLPQDVKRDWVLSQSYGVFIGGVFQFSSMAINTVAQCGESGSMTMRYGTFLTKFDKIKYYYGWERYLSFLPFNNGLTTIERQPYPITAYSGINVVSFRCTEGINSISGTNLSEPLTTNFDEIILTNFDEEIHLNVNGGTQTTSILVEDNCIPDSPLYVRWLNTLGGWDYWMFGVRQFYSSKSEQKEFANRFIESVHNDRRTTDLTNLSVSNFVKAGAGVLSANEFEALKEIEYSPMVDYYDTKQMHWIGCQVSEVANENDTKLMTKSIEITFELPKRNLQL